MAEVRVSSLPMKHKRIVIGNDPFADWPCNNFWHRANWPVSWVMHPEGMVPPGAWQFQLRLDLPDATRVPLHVTADELYELYINGTLVGRGPERGEPLHWHYDSYEVNLPEGTHEIMVRVWAFGRKLGPHGLIGLQPGFLLATSREFHGQLATGVAPWRTKVEAGYSLTKNAIGWGTGPEITLDAAKMARPDSEDSSWQLARADQPGLNAERAFSNWPTHHLVPSTLPAMLERPCRPARVRFIGVVDTALVDEALHGRQEEEGWNGLLMGAPVTVPPHSVRRIILDNGNYLCAYPRLTVRSGAGSRIRLRWAEALFEKEQPNGTPWPVKGHRDEIQGKVFTGYGDTFLPDGARRTFAPPLWRPGRYLELLVVTAAEGVELEDLTLLETHYPLEQTARFESSDPALAAIVPLAVRSLEMCMHQAYFDCPYYEQLMYIGDTRLQALVTYVLSGDDRLPRKAICQFGHSLQSDGLTRSHFPGLAVQTIAPFSLWWIGMLHDFAHWRDDEVFVKSQLNTMRSILNAWSNYLTAGGLVEAPRGWNFADWVPHWDNGMPPDGESGISGILNLQFLLALRWCAELEAHFGEPELASRAKRMAKELYDRISSMFWSETHGLFADTQAHDCWSEHANSLAVLSGMLDAQRLERVKVGLRDRNDLSRATIYFSHYLFEAYAACGLVDCLQSRLSYWSELGKLGFKTTPEQPEPSRSDCHAWGAHPLYHFFASFLGVQPGLGFRTVKVRPQFGRLTSMSGRLPTPHGFIEFDLHHEAGCLSGRMILPSNVTGKLYWAGKDENMGQDIHTSSVPGSVGQCISR
jgi:alpha-L-rhamnosidase